MRLILAAIAVATSTAALAQGAKCPAGSPEVIRLLAWKAEETKDIGLTITKLTIEYENVSGRAFRMIDASARFTDALGESLGAAKIIKDVKIGTGTKHKETGYFQVGLSRLPKVDPRDVVAVACTTGVVFEDGEKATFK